MKTRSSRLVVVAAVVAGLALSLSQGALAQAAQPVIAMVDVQKVFGEYKATQASNQEISGMVSGFEREFTIRDQNRLLTDAELNELIKVKAKDNLAEADRKRIEELEKISKQRDEELNTLSNKAEPTEEERTRLRELRDLSNKNEATARTLAEEYRSQVERRKTELSDKITNEIKAAISKVAQEKGMATVVDKIAVLFGGVDLTEDVIKQLNAS